MIEKRLALSLCCAALAITLSTPAGGSPSSSVQAIRANAGCAVGVANPGLPDGAIGGALFAASSRSMVGGSATHADASQTPAVWTADQSGLYTVRDLGERDGMSRGYVQSITSGGTLLVVYTEPASGQSRTYNVSGTIWTPIVSADGNPDVFGIQESDSGIVLGYFDSYRGLRVGVWRPGSSVVTPLRPLNGYQNVAGEFVNTRGDVVGASQNAAHSETTVWPGGGFPIAGPRLAVPTGTFDLAAVLNDAGRIAGSARAAGTRFHSFVSDPDGRVLDLGSPSGYDYSVLWALSPAGRAGGDVVNTHTGDARATYWSGHGALEVLPGLGGSRATQSSAVFGLDDSGTAWGVSRVGGSTVTQPTIWTCLPVGPAPGGLPATGLVRALPDTNTTAPPPVRHRHVAGPTRALLTGR